MIDCTSCSMKYDEKEYSICPYCGQEPIEGPPSGEASTASSALEELPQEESSTTETDGSKVKKSAFGKIIMAVLAGIVVIAVVAAVYSMRGDNGYTVPHRYPTIQEAIEAAQEGDVIVVAPGVYRENVDFMGKNITLRSTDPDDAAVVSETIIDAGGSGIVVSFRRGEGESAVLSGFTVTRGGGIIVSGGSSPRIEKCIIEDNQAEYGGGIAVFESSPTIVDNVIVANSGYLGGGIFIEESSPLVEGNRIIRNRADMGSGIVVLANSRPEILDNNIADNVASRLGGGVVIAVNSSPLLRGNLITGNIAERNGGGILIEESDPVLENNTISRNRAANGGGIFIVNSLTTALIIKNNSIDNNLAFIAGGGLFMEGSSPLLEGNSFLENLSESLGGGAAVYNSSPTFTGNTFEGNEAEGAGGGGGIWVSEDSELKISEPDDNSYTLNAPDDIFRE